MSDKFPKPSGDCITDRMRQTANSRKEMRINIQHEETGRMQEWLVDKPIPHGWARVSEPFETERADGSARKLEQEWRNAKARVDRWITDQSEQGREIARIEDGRMQRLEKQLGYVPNDQGETTKPEALSDLLDILRSETYWTAGIFNSWTEGRGARAFRNCSIKSIDGEFQSKAEAMHAAEKAIEDRMLSGVRWDTARPTVSFHIPHKTSTKLGDFMDAIMSKATQPR